MARRSQPNDQPEQLRRELVDLLTNFAAQLQRDDLRAKVIALVPAFRKLRDLGSSLISKSDASSGRDRILAYLLKYPQQIVDGDELMALAALHFKRTGRLTGGGVAVTVMTNYGFHAAMRDAEIDVAATNVGDRYVLEALRERGWILGGEQSGHIIDMGFNRSGDGIASALLALEALCGRPLSERDAMAKLPQRLVNVRVRDRGALQGADVVMSAVRAEDDALSGRGRVLVRPSGTEPLVRVMVEAPTDDEAEAVCARLVALVERELA